MDLYQNHKRKIMRIKTTLAIFFGFVLLFSSCKPTVDMTQKTIDFQGHRGCRGLMPENTIPAFKKAIDLGVHTLELDVTVTKEGEVFISHEPFFNHEISQKPNGEPVSEEEERKHNLYTLSKAEIQKYDVGMQPHPRFPLQKKMKINKPTLAEMVNEIEAYVNQGKLVTPNYNIEIKRHPMGDSTYHPVMKTFADRVVREIDELGIMSRTTVQCFDVETLQYLHEKRPDVRLVYLVENKDSFEDNLSKLGFVPYVYSPNLYLIDESTVSKCKEKNILLIPWTVNKVEDIEKMLDLEVDGIITDYPDRLIEIYESRQIQK